MISKALLAILGALIPPAQAQASAQLLYRNPTFAVKNTTDVLYAQGLTCTDGTFPGTNCTPMDLLLDVYEPVAQGVRPVPERKPAYILSHGGGNTGGVKEQYCFQGSAGFMAARGFVAFNIDYRLAHDNGLLPASKMPPAPAPGPHGGSPPPPPPVPIGARLVSHIERSSYFFSPHPQHTATSREPHEGPLSLPGEDGNEVCVTPSGAAAADGSQQLLMQPCEGGAAGARRGSQVWKFAHWDIEPQPVVHAQSGLCLDIAGIGPHPAAGLSIVAAPCVQDREDESHAQLWQLGWSGALITRAGSLSVSVATPTPLSPSAEAEIARTHVGEWTPNWSSAYPAVRDLKAAIRFVRANAAKYGVDPSRIVVSGGSAGATNSVAAGITFDEDYNKELTVSQDPTLATTHQDQNSSVQCVVAHWSTDWEAYLPQMIDPANRTRFTAANAPIVEFHGSIDGTINISHARDAEAHYAKTGVAYQLHVLEGCAHGAWCYNGKTVNGSAVCSCSNGVAGYDDTMDTMALPFVAEQLKLPLV